jgi:hypothetical protein
MPKTLFTVHKIATALEFLRNIELQEGVNDGEINQQTQSDIETCKGILENSMKNEGYVIVYGETGNMMIKKIVENV